MKNRINVRLNMRRSVKIIIAIIISGSCTIIVVIIIIITNHYYYYCTIITIVEVYVRLKHVNSHVRAPARTAF